MKLESGTKQALLLVLHALADDVKKHGIDGVKKGDGGGTAIGQLNPRWTRAFDDMVTIVENVRVPNELDHLENLLALVRDHGDRGCDTIGLTLVTKRGDAPALWTAQVLSLPESRTPSGKTGQSPRAEEALAQMRGAYRSSLAESIDRARRLVDEREALLGPEPVLP